MKELEPYRLLFPVGLLLGVTGVSLWPAFVYGWLPLYPGVLHARIMVEGFVFSFIAGFLLSAMPHMLEVRGPSARQVIMVALLILAVAILHALALDAMADALFALAIMVVVFLVARRWPERADLPPPGFVLPALALISGVVGSLLLAGRSVGILPMYAQSLGRLLLFHGMLLLPVLGVSVYMVPKLVGLPNRQLITPRSTSHSPAWKKSACFMLGCGLIIIAGLVVESFGHLRAGYLLRGAGLTAGLMRELPLFRIRRVNGTIAGGLVLALVSIIAGLWMIAVWPARALTFIHVVMISGVGLMILMISARVVLGHSGNGHMIPARSRLVRWVIGLALLTMATRVSADLLPAMQLSHYAYAGIAWVVVSALWMLRYGSMLLEFPRQTGVSHANG